jgi:hypothetical protein
MNSPSKLDHRHQARRRYSKVKDAVSSSTENGTEAPTDCNIAM